jgi:DNA-binding beta-propeller fold protein YncE
MYNSNGTYIRELVGSFSNVAIDGVGNLFACDTSNSRISVYNSTNGAFIRHIENVPYPWGIAIDTNNNIISASRWNNNLNVIRNDGLMLRTITSPFGFNEPSGMAVTPDGKIVVCDTQNDRIQMFNSSGDYLTMLNGFNRPNAVAINANGYIVVADTENAAIKFIR